MSQEKWRLRFRRRLLGPALVSLASLVVAGCGSSSGSSSTKLGRDDGRSRLGVGVPRRIDVSSRGDPYKGCIGTGEPNYYTATRAWATAHKVALAKFLAAEKEAVSFIATHKSVARAVYAKLSGLPADVAAKAAIYPPEVNFKISVADFAKWESIMKSIGQLPSNVPGPSKPVRSLPNMS